MLHHAQLADVDARNGFSLRRFEVKVSEVGVDIQEAGRIAKALSPNKLGKEVKAAADIIALFQMGPRTGNPVYDDTYALHVVNSIYEACPSGRVTGLTSVRETRKYPVISGEIVKIVGYCMEKKS